MSLQLSVLAGPDKGKTFTLNTGRDLMLGRSANAQYQLSDPRVSRNPCQILLQVPFDVSSFFLRRFDQK